jgi:hypothetical protein
VLSFFTTAKPFRGHINIIQKNALKSWTLLHPEAEVILFGDDEGSDEVARELGIHHQPRVECNEFGAIRLDSMFDKAQAMARHDVLCYVNCDIILMADFRQAIDRIRMKYRQFLVIGRRWDTPITEPLDFSDPYWSRNVRSLALTAKQQRTEWSIDYFAFSRGVYGTSLPPLAIGRLWWDDWLVWKALDSKVPVVDVSPTVFAVHQNHDYSHHPGGWHGVWEGQEKQRNLQLAGGGENLRTISDATAVLHPMGLRRNPKRFLRGLIKPWRVVGESYEFRMRPLGRFRKFVHQSRLNVAFGSTMTRGHLLYSWAHTFVELVVGPENSHYLEGVRTRLKKLVRYFARRPRAA